MPPQSCGTGYGLALRRAYSGNHMSSRASVCGGKRGNGPSRFLGRQAGIRIISAMARSGEPSTKRLDLFRKKMKKVSIAGERGSSINNAFAAALAMVGVFDEDAINNALEASISLQPSHSAVCIATPPQRMLTI